MKQYQDERTLQVRNRIYAELMRIMLCVVVLSFCIKTLYFHMGLTQCMTEYILMILAPVYQAVRIRQTEVVLGTGQDSRKRATPLLLLLLIPLKYNFIYMSYFGTFFKVFHKRLYSAFYKKLCHMPKYFPCHHSAGLRHICGL